MHPAEIAAWAGLIVAVIGAFFSGLIALKQVPQGQRQRDRIEQKVNGNASALQSTIDRQYEYIQRLETAFPAAAGKLPADAASEPLEALKGA